MKDIKIIKWSSIIHLFGRVLAISTICMLYSLGGFFEGELWQLIRTLTPLTIFYVSAFTVYAIKYPHPFSVEKAKRADVATLPITILGYLLYLIISTLSALYPELVSFTLLINMVWVVEILFAISAAISLPKILSRFPLN